ncbi:MAG: tyrosine-type recombinase/integrase [Deltaproteobacteria bacterium]|nr:tyrosine-type recombinase/integrase [Deltaproteobacteria bacterium]
MAYIYRRGKYWWVGYLEGRMPVQKSLKVTSKKAADLLLAEYQLREAKYLHRSDNLIIKINLQDIFDEYIKDRASRVRTKAWYENVKRLFLDFCNYRGVKFAADVHSDTIQEFYNFRKKDYPGGARANIRALKAVFGYAFKKGDIRDNPTKIVRADKPVKKIFRDLSFKEMDRFLKTAKKRDPDFYPLFATAYYSGLRAGELIYLEPSDINFAHGYIYVRCKPENPIKDHQERKIPLNGKLRAVLEKVKPCGRWFFSTKDGNTRKNNLYRKIKAIGKAAGINTDEVSLQTFRETFGSHLRRGGVDIALISQYMGHSSIDVTLRHYAHIPIEQTHKEIDLL